MPSDPEQEELRYFQTLEEAFIRLRGAPLLLSPADWRVAQRWRALGIPLDFAVSAMTELFERRRERGAEGRVSSLRYCARAVEAAWRRAQELVGPVERAREPAFDAASRLRSLAAAIPVGWARDAGFDREVIALTGDAATLESGLQAIDERLLREAERRLTAEESAQLAAWVEERLAALRTRLEIADVESAAQRLRWRELRRRAELPLLSLFSPDAELSESAAGGTRRES